MSFHVFYLIHTDGLLLCCLTWPELWFLAPRLQKAAFRNGYFCYWSISWRCLLPAEVWSNVSLLLTLLTAVQVFIIWLMVTAGKYLGKRLPIFACTLLHSFCPLLVHTGMRRVVEWKQQIWMSARGTFFQVELPLFIERSLYSQAVSLYFCINM